MVEINYNNNSIILMIIKTIIYSNSIINNWQ